LIYLLTGEHTAFRRRVFRTAFEDICRVLSSSSSGEAARLSPQLGVSQPNLLSWTIEEYKKEVQTLVSLYEDKTEEGLNGLPETKKLGNAMHHYCHAIKTRDMPGDLAKSQQLRNFTFELFMKNLDNRKPINVKHMLANEGRVMSDWPEHMKTVAEAGGHLTSIGTPEQRLRAALLLQGLLGDLLQVVHEEQKHTVSLMIAHNKQEMGVIYIAMGAVTAALDHFAQAMTMTRPIAETSGKHLMLRPLENVANTLSMLGRYGEAFDNFDAAIEIIEQLYKSPVHLSLANVLINYGLSHWFNAHIPGLTERVRYDSIQLSFDYLSRGVDILQLHDVPSSSHLFQRAIEYRDKALAAGAKKSSSSKHKKEGKDSRKKQGKSHSTDSTKKSSKKTGLIRC
jgi:tetratricopeptide (TPR) repeat protein